MDWFQRLEPPISCCDDFVWICCPFEWFGVVVIVLGDETVDCSLKVDEETELGAVSNRLNHTVNNLTNISANLSAARGGIEDADFALETTQLAKLQILNQAATAMLAQANAAKQNVVSLLQG